MQEVVQDAATNNEISMAAKSVLDKCVFREGARQAFRPPIGGYMGHVGQCFVHHWLEPRSTSSADTLLVQADMVDSISKSLPTNRMYNVLLIQATTKEQLAPSCWELYQLVSALMSLLGRKRPEQEL